MGWHLAIDGGLLHQIVLLLGKQNPWDPSAEGRSWVELLAALADEYPDLSKSSLCQIVSAHPHLFTSSHRGARLAPLNHDFVRQYFELAEGLEKKVINNTPLDDPFSLSEIYGVTVYSKIVVGGIVCCFETKSGPDRGVIFHFGHSVAYRMKNTLQGDFKQGQMLKSVLRLREMSNIYS